MSVTEITELINSALPPKQQVTRQAVWLAMRDLNVPRTGRQGGSNHDVIWFRLRTGDYRFELAQYVRYLRMEEAGREFTPDERADFAEWKCRMLTGQRQVLCYNPDEVPAERLHTHAWTEADGDSFVCQVHNPNASNVAG